MREISCKTGASTFAGKQNYGMKAEKSDIHKKTKVNNYE